MSTCSRLSYGAYSYTLQPAYHKALAPLAKGTYHNAVRPLYTNVLRPTVSAIYGVGQWLWSWTGRPAINSYNNDRAELQRRTEHFDSMDTYIRITQLFCVILALLIVGLAVAQPELLALIPAVALLGYLTVEYQAVNNNRRNDLTWYNRVYTSCISDERLIRRHTEGAPVLRSLFLCMNRV